MLMNADRLTNKAAALTAVSLSLTEGALACTQSIDLGTFPDGN